MKLKTHIVVTAILLGHLALPVASTHAGGITPVPKLLLVTEGRALVSEDAGGNSDVINNDSLRQTAGAGPGYQDLVIVRPPGPPNPTLAGSTIYIADAGAGLGNGRILRVDITDEPPPYPTNVMFDNLTSPSGVAFDSNTGRLYWSDRGDPKGVLASIMYSDGGPPVVFLADLASAASVRICSSANDKCGNLNKIYWTDAATATIWRADLAIPVPNPVVTGLSAPVGLSIGGNKIYWTDTVAQKIGQADLIGLNSNKNTSFVNSVTDSRGIGVGFTAGGSPQNMLWTLRSTDGGRIRRRGIAAGGNGNNFGDSGLGAVTGIRVTFPPGLVPTISTWGGVVMLLLVLAGGTIAFRHVRASTS